MTEEQDKLVEDNIRLVTFTIRKYYPYAIGDEDAFQQGCIGLIKAATKFEERQGNKFSSFACKCISAEIWSYYRSLTRQKRAANYNASSLNSIANENSEEKKSEFKEFLVDTVDTEECAIRNIEVNAVMNAVNELPEKQAKVFMLYYQEGLPQCEIAKMINMSQMSVSNYIKKASKQINEILKEAI